MEFLVRLSKKTTNMNRTYIIAEAGVNHNGDINLAYKLCDAAKNAGADAVKFQTWKTDKVITKSAELAKYQKDNIINKGETQFDMLKKLEISYEEFIKIKRYCDSIGIQFLSTADEEESLKFLSSLSLPYLKIGSGDITNINYLRLVGSMRLDVLLSTGMAYLSDVDIARRTLLESGAKSVILLHCTTNYPCPLDEVNLKAMVTLKDAFKCSVGYSDHTSGIDVPIAAVALGAEFIEKHFTLDKSMDGPDHKASLDPAELKMMVKSIRGIEQALGSGLKCPNESEKIMSRVVLKKIVACKKIKKGDFFTEDNITVKRSSDGLDASLWDMIEGKVSHYDFDIDQPINI